MSYDFPWKSTWLGAYFPPHPDPPVPSGWPRRLRCWNLAEGWHTHIWRCSVVDKTYFSWKGGRGILKPCRSVRIEDRVGWPGYVYGQCREENYRAEKEDNTKTEGPLGTRRGHGMWAWKRFWIQLLKALDFLLDPQHHHSSSLSL